MTRISCLFVLAVLLLPGRSVRAQEGKWGLGGFVNYHVPLKNLRDRFDNDTKYGFTLNFVSSDAVTMELEYHHSAFGDGKVASQSFLYAVDKKLYTSPEASSTLTFNSLSVNALVFPGEGNRKHGFRAKDYRFYLAVGGGFYRYEAVNEKLVYPAQTSNPIDLTKVLDPQIDQRTTLAVSVGGGMEAFITENLSVDVRSRYNMIIGELRPMLFYGLDRTRPLQLIDVGVGLKLYFWRAS